MNSTTAAPSLNTGILSIAANEIPSKETSNALAETAEPLASSKNDPEEHGCQRESTDSETSHLGMFGDIRVFRDFFLAAFSDGYHNVRILSHNAC
jgi:hypothetical protein